jgi:hypothetical protein
MQRRSCVSYMTSDSSTSILTVQHPKAASTLLEIARPFLISGDASEAKDLWDRLVAIADEKRPVGGSLDLGELLAALRGRFGLREALPS